MKVRVVRGFLYGTRFAEPRHLKPGEVVDIVNEYIPGLTNEGWVEKVWPGDDENKAIPAAPENKRWPGRPRR